jgi:hypothetical protein
MASEFPSRKRWPPLSPAAFVDLTSQVKGILPVANGGTGSSSGALPDQTGHAGQLLSTDGVNAFWTSLVDVGTY